MRNNEKINREKLVPFHEQTCLYSRPLFLRQIKWPMLHLLFQSEVQVSTVKLKTSVQVTKKIFCFYPFHLIKIFYTHSTFSHTLCRVNILIFWHYMFFLKKREREGWDWTTVFYYYFSFPFLEASIIKVFNYIYALLVYRCFIITILLTRNKSKVIDLIGRICL